MEEERAVTQVIQSGWLVQGPKVAEFERTVADYVGVRHAVATSSCTTALHLALTCVELVQAMRLSFHPSLLLRPRMRCGIQEQRLFLLILIRTPTTLTLSALRLPSLRARKRSCRYTRSVLPLIWIVSTRSLDNMDLVVIEDAAPAIGAMYKGRWLAVLVIPRASVFILRKVITSGEGGMILTERRERGRACPSFTRAWDVSF